MLFDRRHLSDVARKYTKNAFNRGKSPGFDVDAEVQRFARAARGQRVLHQMFLQVQLSAVSADGAAHPAEHAMLMRIARGLGPSEAEVQAQNGRVHVRTPVTNAHLVCRLLLEKKKI